MDTNKIYEIMARYNAGELNKVQAVFLLITDAGCDAEGVQAVFAVYSKESE